MQNTTPNPNDNDQSDADSPSFKRYLDRWAKFPEVSVTTYLKTEKDKLCRFAVLGLTILSGSLMGFVWLKAPEQYAWMVFFFVHSMALLIASTKKN
jgi:hypothetical protein